MQDKGQTNNIKELEVTRYLAKGDKFVLYLYNKVTRLSYAVYAVSEFIKDKEPLKWQLRNIAITMMSLKNFDNEESVFYETKKSLMELESMLELGRFTKIVSLMNYDVFKNELSKTIKEIDDRSGQNLFSETIALTEFFEVARPDVSATNLDSERSSNININENNISKGHNVRYDFYKNVQKNFVPQRLKKDGSEEVSKGGRRDKILEVIKDKIKSSGIDSVSIKDITNAIKDCSEKTIQRELVSLVSDNVLSKTGERRWSTYSLKTV